MQLPLRCTTRIARDGGELGSAQPIRLGVPWESAPTGHSTHKLRMRRSRSPPIVTAISEEQCHEANVIAAYNSLRSARPRSEQGTRAAPFSRNGVDSGGYPDTAGMRDLDVQFGQDDIDLPPSLGSLRRQ